MNIEELLAKINAWRAAYERWAGLDAQALYQTADYKEMNETAEAVTGSAHDTRQYQVITTLADEIRRLRATAVNPIVQPGEDLQRKFNEALKIFKGSAGGYAFFLEQIILTQNRDLADLKNDLTMARETCADLEAKAHRLQAIESRATTINNALLAATQSMMQFLTPQVQERMQQALQPVIDLMEQKP